MGILFLLFVLVPALELALLAEVGAQIGWLPTLGLIVATGFLGAALARAQGFEVLRRIQLETAEGRVPAEALIDGAMVVFAGALLLTPGILTDAVGFALLLPPIRMRLKRSFARRVAASVARGQTVVFFRGVPPGPSPHVRRPIDPERVYDAEFDDD